MGARRDACVFARPFASVRAVAAADGVTMPAAESTELS